MDTIGMHIYDLMAPYLAQRFGGMWADVKNPTPRRPERRGLMNTLRRRSGRT
jgi:hypothetical protein